MKSWGEEGAGAPPEEEGWRARENWLFRRRGLAGRLPLLRLTGCCSAGRATALFLKVAVLLLLGLARDKGGMRARVLLLDGVFSLVSSPRRTSKIMLKVSMVD